MLLFISSLKRPLSREACLLREDLDDRFLSFFIFFLRNPSAKLLVAVDEQHPRQNSSGVAARTRVCSQTKQNEEQRVAGHHSGSF